MSGNNYQETKVPNWTCNQLYIKHAEIEKIQQVLEACQKDQLFDAFVPIPDELRNTVSPNRDANAESLKEKYGYSDWYAFCVEEWGTKWDAASIHTDGRVNHDDSGYSLSIYFETAWSPPLEWYRKIQAQGFSILAYYYEAGMGICGIIEDDLEDHYDLSDLTSREAARELPPELDQAFNIVECIQEYEEENGTGEDEVTAWYKDGVDDLKLTPHDKKQETDL